MWVGVLPTSGAVSSRIGIPIDMAVTPGTAMGSVLTWNVEETALAVHTAGLSCAPGLNAVVVKEDGNAIASAAMAIDENGVVAIVWSSEDPSTGEWEFIGRLLDPETCQSGCNSTACAVQH